LKGGQKFRTRLASGKKEWGLRAGAIHLWRAKTFLYKESEEGEKKRPWGSQGKGTWIAEGTTRSSKSIVERAKTMRVERKANQREKFLCETEKEEKD